MLPAPPPQPTLWGSGPWWGLRHTLSPSRGPRRCCDLVSSLLGQEEVMPRVAQMCQRQPCPGPPSRSREQDVPTLHIQRGRSWEGTCTWPSSGAGTGEWRAPLLRRPLPPRARGCASHSPADLFLSPPAQRRPPLADFPSQSCGLWRWLQFLIVFLPLNALLSPFPFTASAPPQPRPLAARGGDGIPVAFPPSPSIISFVLFSFPFLLPLRAQPL